MATGTTCSYWFLTLSGLNVNMFFSLSRKWLSSAVFLGYISFLRGDISFLTGNIRFLRGDVSFLTGDIRLLRGDISFLR